MFNRSLISSKPHIEEAPDEILSNIFSFLRQTDLIHASRVNKNFYRLSCLNSVVKTAGNNYSADSSLYSYLINQTFVRRAVAVLPDKQIAIGCKSGMITIWDYDKDKIVTQFCGLPLANEQKNPEVLCLAYIGQDKIISTVYNKTLRIFNYKKSQHLHTLIFNESIRCALVLDDNKIALGNYKGKIIILDMKSFERSKEFGVGTSWLQRMCKLPNDELAVASCDGSIRIYNWKNLSHVRAICENTENIWGKDVIYLGENKIAASRQDGLKILNYQTGECLFELLGEKISSKSPPYEPNKCGAIVRIGQDKIACSREDFIEIWNFNTGKLLQRIDDHRQVLSYTLHT